MGPLVRAAQVYHHSGAACCGVARRRAEGAGAADYHLSCGRVGGASISITPRTRIKSRLLTLTSPVARGLRCTARGGDDIVKLSFVFFN
jgi:hypothetical protein